MKTQKHLYIITRWIYKKFNWDLVMPYFMTGLVVGSLFISFFDVRMITIVPILINIFITLLIARTLHFLSFYPAGLFFPTIIGDTYRLSWKKKLFIYTCTVIFMILFFYRITESF